MTWTNEDSEKMEKAAQDAEKELRALLAKPMSAQDLMAFHAKWYTSAGHKRLGRLYVEIAKASK